MTNDESLRETAKESEARNAASVKSAQPADSFFARTLRQAIAYDGLDG